WTVPPPAAEAAAIALSTAGVSRVLPSPVAPNVFTSYWVVIALSDSALAAVAPKLIAPPETPRPAIFSNSRRAVLSCGIGLTRPQGRTHSCTSSGTFVRIGARINDGVPWFQE